MSSEIYPNLFVLGAPKCGTTSVANWLRQHGEVFVPTSKEPHHFNVDHNFLVYKDEKDYLDLYRNANKQYACDASVWYLYSKVAITNILHKRPDSKFIVCLRNPMDMALSLFLEQRYATNEHIADYFEAWKSSNDRRQGLKVSKWCREPLHLDYQSACLLGNQVSRLLASVERDNVHFVFLDDLKKSPQQELSKILRFLGLDYDNTVELTVANIAKTVKYKHIKRFVRLLGALRQFIPIKTKLGILNYFNKVNQTKLKSKPQLTDAQSLEISQFYRDDIEHLSKLTGKDLSSWVAFKND
ncbi:sulfotransferase [Shewanella sp. 10N.286.45.A1]|uniref:sulfotransferase family protein n=1 Tax=Shewanella sp. 10N.286.45.A1 TaxID=3229694 RepID=UPI003552A272